MIGGIRFRVCILCVICVCVYDVDDCFDVNVSLYVSFEFI